MDINDDSDRAFTLMDKPNNNVTTKNEGPEETKGEDLKKSTISDYLPSIFGRRKQEEPPSAGPAA